jgi:hypothetical protein
MKEDDYAKITVDYPIAAAKAFSGLESKMNFVHISGEGADMDEKASFLFGRIKGRAEKTLLELQQERPSLRVYNIRPAIINPEGKYIAERRPTLHDKISTLLGNICERVFKSTVISTEALGKACVALATEDGEPIATGDGVEAEDGF